MIPSPFRIVEITLYSMLTFLPFVVMIFYPAREKLRFPPAVTALFMTVLAALHLAADTVIALGLYGDTDLVILASILAHGLIYLLLFKQPIGRTLFTWLAVTNLAALVTTAAKCLEGLLFPSTVNEVFALTYLFLLLAVEALIMGPSLLLVKKLGLVFRFPKIHWNLAWILPTACTAFWYIYMYIGFSFTDTWITIRPVNSLVLLAINLVFALVCFKPTRSFREKEAAVDEAVLAANAEVKAQRAAERAEAKAKRAAERAEAKAKRAAERAEAKAKREAEKAEKEAAKAAVAAAEGETPAPETAEQAPVEAAAEETPAAEETSAQEAETPAEEAAPAEAEPAEETAGESPAPEETAKPEPEAPAAPVPAIDPQGYLLRVQTVQHVNMLEKMAEAQRVNQDLHLQLNMMEDSLARNDYRKLREQLQTFHNLLPSIKAVPFCEHPTVNNLLHYYAQAAKNYGTVFHADVKIPAGIPIRGRDLTVLLGNLLDNAIDACRSQKSFDRQIRIQGFTAENSIHFVIENTCEIPAQRVTAGVFRSTKHSGDGIGLEITKEITCRYNGTMDFEISDRLFKVSVTLNP